MATQARARGALALGSKRQWSSGKVESFASDHFDAAIDGRGGFRDFVNALYKAGAKQVLVREPLQRGVARSQLRGHLAGRPPVRPRQGRQGDGADGRKEHPDEVDVGASGVRVWWD